MSTADRQIQIVDGGNKFELHAQLGDIGRVKPDRPTFTMVLQHPRIRGASSQESVEVLINGITAEDGSGESWMITGVVMFWELAESHWVRREFSGNRGSFKGLYNTRKRMGFLVSGS